MFLLREQLDLRAEREIGVRWYRASVVTGGLVELELEPIAITSVDGGCARAVTFGEEQRCSGE
jgi:hypothetical protein